MAPGTLKLTETRWKGPPCRRLDPLKASPQAGLPAPHCTLGSARMELSTPLTYVKGIGPARAAMLESKGLAAVEDLLAYVPFRYEDRSNVKTVAQLAPGEMATVIADVRSAKASGFHRRSLGLFEANAFTVQLV